MLEKLLPILKIGIGGLAFGLAYLAFQLVRDVIAHRVPNKTHVVIACIFMLFEFLLILVVSYIQR